MNLLAIDIGLKGYICFAQSNEQTLHVKSLFKIELEDIKENLNAKNKKEKKVVSFIKTLDKIKNESKQNNFDLLSSVCIFEELFICPIHSRSSCFSSGFNFGITNAIAQSITKNIFIVKPALWKDALNLSKDKKQSFELLEKLIKDGLIIFECNVKKLTHDAVESILLAFYHLSIKN